MKSKHSLPLWISQRASGSLLHLTSLPGSYGIGNLGMDARAFVDFLERSGIRFWQTCPVGPTGYGDSPYQVFSSFAGNPYLIDWDALMEIGLIRQDELSKLRALPSHEVDYGSLYFEFFPCARLAFSRFSDLKEELEVLYGDVESFSAENDSWLTSYACFQVLKEREEGKPWWKWSDSSKKPDSVLLTEIKNHTDFSFHVFLQYLFWGQWKSLRAYANERNVSLLGDLPIYAAPDSSEVWQRPDLFQVMSESTFSHVAGVPPDYFNENGQYWGNPLYDWDRHEAEGYSWWMDRLAVQLKLFDVVRIDHFRGFHDYWSISTKTNDARIGSWIGGPGMKFWEVAHKRFPTLPFLAEDLGLISDEVRDLRRNAGLPGMAVLQFAFDGDEGNLYLPHNLENDLVLYTGTHDNDTTTGWYASASEEVKGNFRTYLNVSGSIPSWDMLRLAYRSVAPLVVVPVQDLLGLGSEARLNEPGFAMGNWKWRLTRTQLDQLERESASYLAEQAKITGRLAISEEMD
jgi:4-alpha-glucanotransferase